MLSAANSGAASMREMSPVTAKAAHRHDIGMDQMAFQEDGDGGGAAAHVDHGGADLLFVLGQGWKGR